MKVKHDQDWITAIMLGAMRHQLNSLFDSIHESAVYWQIYELRPTFYCSTDLHNEHWIGRDNEYLGTFELELNNDGIV